MQDSDFNVDNSNQHQQLRTPTSQDACFNGAARIKLDSRPPIMVEVRPVIQSADIDNHTFGRLAGLAPAVHASVMKLLGASILSERLVSLSTKGSHQCAERLIRNAHGTYWTIDRPGQFTCKTCFNGKTPCMRMAGDHQWIVLPLPPAVRDPDAVWQDKAYYVNQYEGTSIRFPRVWRAKTKSKEAMAMQ